MIVLSGVRLTPGHEDLKGAAAKKLKIAPGEIASVRYLKKSLDARKKNDIFYACTLEVTVTGNEGKIIKRCPDAVKGEEKKKPENKTYVFRPHARPVVCGAGPAGLFAALTLARAGLKPLLVERGADVEKRVREVRSFRETGILNTQTNVQFGEGGAGTFSDGKLTTNVHDARVSQVLETFVSCGAPEEITYLAKPHLGTDRLSTIVKTMREKIIDLGGEVRFETQLTDITVKDGQVKECTIVHNNEPETIPTEHVIVAAGHSARDVFELAKKIGVEMEKKPFSVGVRIEHKQEEIDRAQYGDFAPLLPPADYKLVHRTQDGRGVYSFCMCPGGTVVAAASEEGHLVVNGMSESARDGENANAALLCDVRVSDLGEDLFAGVDFQQSYEKAAFRLGGGAYRAPAQRLGDFLAGRPSSKGGRIKPTYPLGVTWTDLSACLPDFAVSALREAVPVFDRKIRGFADPDAVLTGVETRSSSPLRLKRDETCQSSVRGLYPCGEGAGYAGGITSAAVDGIRVAEAIIQDLEEAET